MAATDGLLGLLTGVLQRLVHLVQDIGSVFAVSGGEDGIDFVNWRHLALLACVDRLGSCLVLLSLSDAHGHSLGKCALLRLMMNCIIGALSWQVCIVCRCIKVLISRPHAINDSLSVELIFAALLVSPCKEVCDFNQRVRSF